MTFYNSLYSALLRKLPKEIILEILAFINLNELYRHGANISDLVSIASVSRFRFPDSINETLIFNHSNELFKYPSKYIWFICPPEVFQCYLLCFKEQTLKVLNGTIRDIKYIHLIIYYDRLDLLKRVYQYFLDENLVEMASKFGKLNITKFLIQNNVKVTIDAIDNAATNGYLDIVEWLHHNTAAPCSSRALKKCCNELVF